MRLNGFLSRRFASARLLPGLLMLVFLPPWLPLLQSWGVAAGMCGVRAGSGKCASREGRARCLPQPADLFWPACVVVMGVSRSFITKLIFPDLYYNSFWGGSISFCIFTFLLF